MKLFPVMGCWTKNQSWANCDFLGAWIPSLNTQGQSVWSGEKAQIMKVYKQGLEEPLGTLFQTAIAILVSDWYQIDRF